MHARRHGLGIVVVDDAVGDQLVQIADQHALVMSGMLRRRMCQCLVLCQPDGHGRGMDAIVHVLALLIVGPLVGVELAVAVFLNPALGRLPDEAFAQARSDSGRVLGKVMPFWYVAALVVLIVAAVLLRADWLFITAALTMALVVVATVTLMVPINNRIGRWSEGADVDRGLARQWDRLHWRRVALLVVVFGLVVVAVAEV